MNKHAVNYTRFLSLHSLDPKVKVGCTIFELDTDKIIGLGYNGNPEVLPQERDSLEAGKSGYLHAELRAALSCKVVRNTKKEVYINLPPCENCSKVLVELGGVVKVYYTKNPSYSLKGIELLKNTGIEVREYE